MLELLIFGAMVAWIVYSIFRAGKRTGSVGGERRCSKDCRRPLFSHWGFREGCGSA